MADLEDQLSDEEKVKKALAAEGGVGGEGGGGSGGGSFSPSRGQGRKKEIKQADVEQARAVRSTLSDGKGSFPSARGLLYSPPSPLLVRSDG